MMDFKTSMKISSQGMGAHRTWLNVTSANLANINTTRTEDGEPYRRRTLIYQSDPPRAFDHFMDDALEEQVQGVEVVEILPDNREFAQVYDPDHPDADDEGYVRTPNINPVEEMANLMNASRSYEANLAALSTAKKLILKSLEIGK